METMGEYCLLIHFLTCSATFCFVCVCVAHGHVPRNSTAHSGQGTLTLNSSQQACLQTSLREHFLKLRSPFLRSL